MQIGDTVLTKYSWEGLIVDIDLDRKFSIRVKSLLNEKYYWLGFHEIIDIVGRSYLVGYKTFDYVNGKDHQVFITSSKKVAMDWVNRFDSIIADRMNYLKNLHVDIVRLPFWYNFIVYQTPKPYYKSLQTRS